MYAIRSYYGIDNLQTIGALPGHKQALIAEETRTVYVPLARHLGMGYVASEMEALSVGILYPRRQASYRAGLEHLKLESEGFLRRVKGEMQRVV